MMIELILNESFLRILKKWREKISRTRQCIIMTD